MLRRWRPSTEPADRRRSDAGFTVLELSVSTLLAAIVIASAGDALVSLSSATYRHDSTVKVEQADSQVMAQIERDIRSAATISIPTGASASQQLQLAVANAAGTTTNVLWVYDPAGGTFSRRVQVNGSFGSSGYSISNVSNGSGTPVFTYSNLSLGDISGTSASNIAQCATAVGINVKVSPPTKGVGTFQEMAEVALTNRLEVLTAPGNGQCGGVAG